jgi:transcriptional regulator with XRE-family HTH domain
METVSIRGGIGKTIRQIRRGRGISRRELAEQLGCPKNTVVLWELGRHVPNAGRLIKLLGLAQPDEAATIREALQYLGVEPGRLALPDTSQIPPAAEASR